MLNAFPAFFVCRFFCNETLTFGLLFSMTKAEFTKQYTCIVSNGRILVDAKYFSDNIKTQLFVVAQNEFHFFLRTIHSVRKHEIFFLRYKHQWIAKHLKNICFQFYRHAFFFRSVFDNEAIKLSDASAILFQRTIDSDML